MKDARDRALLLIGFAGGFRRSEIVGLDCDDIERVRQGLIVTLIRSKTDQEGAGRKVGIPFGRTRHCPVLALEQWLAVSGIKTGPVFRPVDRHGHIAAQRLSGETVSVNVKERVAMANIDPTGYSGHSLRAGFATSAVQAGVSTLKIRSQTGHASEVSSLVTSATANSSDTARRVGSAQGAHFVSQEARSALKADADRT